MNKNHNKKFLRISSAFTLLLSAGIFGVTVTSFAEDTVTGSKQETSGSKESIVNADSAEIEEAIANKEKSESKENKKPDEVKITEKDIAKTEKKSYLESDELSYDTITGDVIGTGNVRIDHEERKLKADKVTYNQVKGEINALGNVELLNQDGSTYYADSVYTNDKVTTGTVQNVKGVLADGSTFKSSGGELVERKKLIMHDAQYSPCKPCESGKYFWSVKADRVKYNEDTGRVGYKGATLNFFDVPVVYTPFISHPTPNAKSKSGFLSPSFGSSSDMGFNIGTPYYWQPESNYDFTFMPRLSITELPVLGVEHRHLFETGSYKFLVSGAYPEERDDFGNRTSNGREFRGHIEGEGSFDVGKDWNFNFYGKRTTDDTYLRRYKYGSEDTLTSEAALEKIDERNYTEIKTVNFQGLRATDDPSKIPYVLPIITQHTENRMENLQDTFLVSDFNFMNLDRDEGPKSRRISQKVGLNKKQITDSGSILEYGASSRVDGYNFDEVTYAGNNVNGSRGRFIPQAEAKWSMPLIKQFETSSLVVEPVVNTAVSPNGNNSDLIPNEDSQSLEFADYNIFDSSRYSGLDRVESGIRTSYGVRSNLYNQNIGNMGFVLGQIYRGAKDRYLTPDTGMSDNLSDYVGRLTFDNGKYFSANYRYRMNKKDFKFERNEVGMAFSTQRFSIGSNYSFINGTDGAIDRQELSSGVTLGLNDNWKVFGSGIENLDNSETKGLVTTATGLEFSNECLKASVEVRRDFIRDRDIEPSTEFLFKFTLQNMGMN